MIKDKKKRVSRKDLTDYTGKTFGRLTVLEFAYSSEHGKGRFWKCQCICGKTCLANTSSLNRGKKLSCGCLSKERQYQNLIGVQFGNLTVKEKIGIAGDVMLWRCQCICGNTKDICSAEINRGKLLSCGCSRPRYQHHYEEICLSLWHRYEYDAANRGLDFEITVQEIWDLYIKQNRKCALTGIPITFGKRYTKDKSTASIDRINSSKGYTMNNIQWVHKSINYMKGTLTMDEFLNWCNLVHQHQQSK